MFEKIVKEFEVLIFEVFERGRAPFTRQADTTHARNYHRYQRLDGLDVEE